MIRGIAILFIVIFLPLFAYSQNTQATIENVDFNIADDWIIVTYNIENAPKEESYGIELKFITKSNEVITPKTVQGDIGEGIPGGQNKTIKWNVLKDRDALNESIKAVITVSSVLNTKYQYIGGGPANMFLSMICPGWGDFLVRKDQSKKSAYALIPIATYGVLTFAALSAGMESFHQGRYDDAYYQTDMDKYYEKANNWHRRGGIATRLAFTMWVGDMVWVFFKGIRNNVIKKKYNLASNTKPIEHDYYLGYDPVAEGIQLTYVVKF